MTYNAFPNQTSFVRKSVAEFFAGIGLVRLGLEHAGWDIAFANDISETKYEMYASYFNDAAEHFLVKDIFEIRADDVPTTLLATASFPCIDLSVAGKRNGLNGKHSSAFWGFVDILEKLSDRRPPLVMLENVTGWITSNQGADFRLTLKALNDLGYACDVLTLNALHFTPQSRPRVFIVGYMTDMPNRDVFRLLRRSSDLSSKALQSAVEANFDLDWHTVTIPEPPVRGEVPLSEIVEHLSSSDPRWWSDEEVRRHLSMMSTLHYKEVKNLSCSNFPTFRTMYRRVRKGIQRAEVRSDELAGCLRTARGGSSKQMLVQAGYGTIQMRHMTPREYARLQGVPDNYPIPHNVNQALTGFGDAVCVPAITWLADNVLEQLCMEYSNSLQITVDNFQQNITTV